ncbi:MAG: hypothetical protein ACLQE9_12475 [Roseiarcus sp.]
MERQIARRFKKEIGDGEDAGGVAELVGRQSEVLPRRSAREADVHAFEIGDEIAKHEKRREAPAHLVHRALFDAVHGFPGRSDRGEPARRRLRSF